MTFTTSEQFAWHKKIALRSTQTQHNPHSNRILRIQDIRFKPQLFQLVERKYLVNCNNLGHLLGSERDGNIHRYRISILLGLIENVQAHRLTLTLC